MTGPRYESRLSKWYSAYSCPMDFKFPNTVSGDCSCNGKFVCEHASGLPRSWSCSGLWLDCGNNICAKIRRAGWGARSAAWEVNEIPVNTIHVEPVNGLDPNGPVDYTGPLIVSWIPVASSLTESSVFFTDPVAKKAATTNKLYI